MYDPSALELLDPPATCRQSNWLGRVETARNWAVDYYSVQVKYLIFSSVNLNVLHMPSRLFILRGQYAESPCRCTKTISDLASLGLASLGGCRKRLIHALHTKQTACNVGMHAKRDQGDTMIWPEIGQQNSTGSSLADCGRPDMGNLSPTKF